METQGWKPVLRLKTIGCWVYAGCVHHIISLKETLEVMLQGGSFICEVPTTTWALMNTGKRTSFYHLVSKACKHIIVTSINYKPSGCPFSWITLRRLRRCYVTRPVAIVSNPSFRCVIRAICHFRYEKPYALKCDNILTWNVYCDVCIILISRRYVELLH